MNKILVFVVFLLLPSCIMEREYVVDSDYSYTGKFKKYKTFGFMIDQETEDDSLVLVKNTIEEAIRYRMEWQGYKYNEKEPNLLISYKIFEKDMNYRGYYQPDMEYWVRVENEQEEYKPIKYYMKEGTLVIAFFDRKQRSTIWQGYASGLFSQRESAAQARSIKRAVRLIFDQYRILSESLEENISN